MDNSFILRILTSCFLVSLATSLSPKLRGQDETALVLHNDDQFLDNILFRGTGSRNLKLKHWSIHFSYTYGKFAENIPDFLDDLVNYVKQAEQTNILMHSYSSSASLQVGQLFSRLLSEQIRAINDVFEKILQTHEKIIDVKKMLNSNGIARKKRSLLPVGGLLSAIFGTGSEKDILRLTRRIQNLEKSSEAINHFAEDSISAINSSYVFIKQNRQKIFDLESLNTEIFNDLFNRSAVHQQYISLQSQYLTESSQHVETLFKAQQVLNELKSHFDTSLTEISILGQNRLPSTLLRPGQLKDLLLEIRSHLPSQLSLPYEIPSHLIFYYNHMDCMTLRGKNKLIINCNVGLLDSQAQFRFFEVQSFPFIMSPEEDSPGVLARIQPDITYFGVSRDETKVTIMTKKDYRECMQKSINFCHLKSAIMSMKNYEKSCVLSLYLNRQYDPNLCVTEILKYDPEVPSFHHIIGGNWLILYKEPIFWNRYCTGQGDVQIRSRAQYDILKVPYNCELVSREAQITGSLSGTTDLDLEDIPITGTVVPHKFLAELYKKVNKTVIPPPEKMSELPDRWMVLSRAMSVEKINENDISDDWNEKGIFSWGYPSILLLCCINVVMTICLILIMNGFMRRSFRRIFHLRGRNTSRHHIVSGGTEMEEVNPMTHVPSINGSQDLCEEQLESAII